MKLVVYQSLRAKWRGKDWEYAKSNQFSLNSYNAVYEEDYEVPREIQDKPTECLSYIYQLITWAKPINYWGDNLDYGDIIEVDEIKYYIDHLGLHKCEE